MDDSHSFYMLKYLFITSITGTYYLQFLSLMESTILPFSYLLWFVDQESYRTLSSFSSAEELGFHP
jgi:hypothetical protein